MENKYFNFRKCMDCKTRYSPNRQKAGRMPKGYKKCPHCNSENTEWEK